MSSAKAKINLKTWPYAYDSLEHEQSIRCFDLWPGKFEDDLMVSLCTTTRNKNVTYEAISYVWGDAKKTQRVLVMEPDNWTGFGYVDVPVNLGMALRRVRREDEEICLWADALCINQDNDLEKGHQVRQMSSIFGKAQQVLVWLGPDITGEGAKAFKFAEEFSKLNEPTGFPWFRSKSAHKMDYEDIGAKALNKLETGGVKRLVWLAQHMWFRRIWTMQELGCSKAATILFGSASIPWKVLYGAYDLAIHLGVGGMETSCLKTITLLYHWQTSNWLGFLRIVSRLRHHDTSDPRDRIYGLLGHPCASTRTDTGKSVLILEPDYGKAVNEVYMEAAEAMLLQEGNLHLLSYIRPRNPYPTATKGPQLPSWAPDWKMQEVTHHISDGMQNSCGTKGGPLYHIPPIVHRNADVYELHTSGVPCGRVIWSWSTKDLGRWEAMATFRALSSHLVHDPAYYLTRAIHTYSLPRFTEITFERYSTSEYRQRTLDAAVTAAEVKLSIGRRVFFTDTNLFGLGPGTVQQGDVLYVLHAGCVPYLLRSGDIESSKAPLACSTHTLVGECLVEDLMHGEVIGRVAEARDLVLV